MNIQTALITAKKEHETLQQKLGAKKPPVKIMHSYQYRMNGLWANIIYMIDNLLFQSVILLNVTVFPTVMSGCPDLPVVGFEAVI